MTPILFGHDFVSMLWAFVLIILVLACILTLIGGFVLLARYRRAVDRLMKEAASAGQRSAASMLPPASTGANSQSELAVRSLTATKGQSAFKALSRSIAGAMRTPRAAALVQIAAGCAFAVVATGLLFFLGGLPYHPLHFALIFWSWVWPVVVVLVLLWGGERKKTIVLFAVYFGGLLLICSPVAFNNPINKLIESVYSLLFSWTRGAISLAFLLFFLNRTVRSIGPILLILPLIAGIGATLAFILLGTPVGTSAGAAFSMLIWWMTAGLLPIPWSTVLAMVTILLLGMIFLPLGWRVISGIRRAYQTKRLSDQVLVFDAIWVFQTLILCWFLVSTSGAVGWAGVVAFVAYKGAGIVGSLPLAAAASRHPAAKLLLLRVFGFRKRTERLFDMLEARWRYVGPIQTIAAPDLAARTIDPAEFMDFLSGRLRQQFIIDPGDLERRLADIDMQNDPDGRFRVNDIFCGNDTWQAAVERLMGQSDLILMDLRGFSPQNKGCSFELQTLLDTVPTTRFVLTTDNTTDVLWLRRALAEGVGRMAPASPNHGIPHPIMLLEVGNDRQGVNAVLAIADGLLAEPPDLVPEVSSTTAAN